jgi:fructose-bisphosphate aldolase, class II
MTMVRMDELLKQARKEKYAVAAFECWNSANIYGIAAGAAECGMPVIFQASPVEYGIMGGPEALRKIVELYVEMTGITAALHLDHGSTLAQVDECAKAGFTSVMLDASRESFAKNVELSQAAVKISRQYNLSVEAELGHVGGCEGEFADCNVDLNDVLTKPDEAVEFVRETGIDCLAVGIGTVHGDYRGEPRIDLERLDKIASLVDIPLVLHGGSGTPEDILLKAIDLGIAKINICTDIHKTWLAGIDLAKAELTPSIPGKFYQPAHDMLKQNVMEIIKLFSNSKVI